ncbi:hypothetical protein [Amycolatopsis sp. NPDC054798]
MTTFIPWAQGVPFESGPPVWWTGAPTPPPTPGETPRVDTSLSDPRWQGSVGLTYPDIVGGAGEQAVFRGVYHIQNRDTSPYAPQTFLYLSWWVKVDPQLNPGLDELFVGFTKPGQGAVVFQIRPFDAAPPTGQPVVAGRFGTAPQVYFPTGTTAGGATDAPGWLGTVSGDTGGAGRVWVDSDQHQWAISLRLPLVETGNLDQAGIASGLNLGTEFSMWYDARVRMLDSGGKPKDADHLWPRTSSAAKPGPAGLTFPDQSTWGSFKLGAPDAAAQGVALRFDEIGIRPPGDTPGSTAPLGNEIKFNDFNNFAANPDNRTTAEIPAGAISATFRLANWGSNKTDPSLGSWDPLKDQDGKTEWSSVLPIPAGTKAPNGAITGTTATNGTITFPWKTTDPNYQAHPHQCMLVELSSPGTVDFINSSVYRNMQFVGLNAAGPPPGGLLAAASSRSDDRESAFSRFSQSAEINIKGLPPLGRPKRNVYLYVQTVNMPKDETPPSNGGSERAAASADYQPTYRVHVFHETGETHQENGKTIGQLAPQGSFGYVFHKDGDSFGWDHQLRGEGLVRISPNFYRLSVPDGGKATVSTKVVSWSEPRPWWWELWEFLMDLWDNITGSLRNPHHGA